MRAYQDYQRTEDELETIHVYMLREPLLEEQQQKSQWAVIEHWIMSCLAVLLLSGFCLIPDSPVYVTKQISVSVIPLPLVQLSVSVTIVPTGVSTIPALQAHGTLTIYNGSILQEALPAGFLVTTHSGGEIATDRAVTIPAGNPPTYGTATVAAHAVIAGAAGNIVPGSINQADGTSLVVKNLTAFTGGQDASVEHVITSGDIHSALTSARARLSMQQPIGLLSKPCTESKQQNGAMLILTWRCHYVTYKAPPGITPIDVRVQGDRVILTVRVAQIPR